LQKEKETKDSLQKKIQAMESKLLTGGKNIIDHTNEQQRALEQRRVEIAEQQRKERDMQRKLEEQEESTINVQETYNSLQQEVDIKTKRLRKLFAKLQAAKLEIRDLQEEHVKERQELEQTQNELTRELKLRMLIIDNFIPNDDKKKTMGRAEYDEDQQLWKLKLLTKGGTDTMAKRPASAIAGRKWPISDFAKRAGALSGGFRFAGENILCVELDLPNRTTRDYEGPSIAPRIQAVLDAAMEDEGDIEIDDSQFGDSKGKCNKGSNFMLNSSHEKATNHRKREQQLYPTSRGLVPK
jgi:kinesin family protein 3/17